MFRAFSTVLAIVPTLAVLSLPATATAQHKGFGTVIGITGHPSGPTLLRMDMDSCKFASCPAGIKATKFTDGGSAYDPRLQGIWVSTGQNLACIDPETCRPICREIPAPFAPPTQRDFSPLPPVVGGLAMDHRQNFLYMADTANSVLHQVSIGRDCAFKATSCDISTNLPPNHVIGGLAIDNVRRLLFVGSYDPGTGAVSVYVTPLEGIGRTMWCQKRCELFGSGLRSFPPQCPSPKEIKPERLTGLAFDSCRSLLYVTNGPWTTAYAYSAPGKLEPTCEVRAATCCNYPSKVLNDQYIGLAILPPAVESHGKPCTGKNCDACPGMIARTEGNSSIGNGDFALVLENAPSTAAPVFLGISVGPCTSPGISLGFCAPILLDPPTLSVFAIAPIVGSGTCGASARIPLPLPPSYAGCGLTISTQFVMGCKSAVGAGVAVTNCLEFVINGG